MNAMAEPQAFNLPKKPKIRQQEPPPDQRKVAVVPIRALKDRQLGDASLRALALLCSYCNRAGITWVGQKKLAEDAGMSQQAISKHIAKLIQAGYVEVLKKGFRGERANTWRVIFDPSVDANTAMAITSAQEPTRPTHMDEPDPEGQKRIAQLISKALKKPPTKEYTMPKSGQSITVQKMHEEIAKAGKKRSKPVDNHVDDAFTYTTSRVVNEDVPKVVNEEPPYTTSYTTSEVVQTQENTVLDSLNKDSFKELKTVFRQFSDTAINEIKAAGLTDREATEALTTLLAAYQAEGITPNPDRLAIEVIQLAEVGRGIS